MQPKISDTKDGKEWQKAGHGRAFVVLLIDGYMPTFLMFAYAIIANDSPKGPLMVYGIFAIAGVLYAGIPGMLSGGKTLGMHICGCSPRHNGWPVSPQRALLRGLFLSWSFIVSFYTIIYSAVLQKNWPFDPLFQIYLWTKRTGLPEMQNDVEPELQYGPRRK